MNKVDFDKMYSTTHYGDFKIIEDLGPSPKDSKRRVKIKFLLTGTEKIVRFDQINHDIRDPYYPRIYGVACAGNLDMGRDVYKPMYDTWISMISRCYNPLDKDYNNYGGIGVKVSNDWLCFEYYFKDLPYLPNYNLKCEFPYEYQLDKDYLQAHIPQSQRIYSKETCLFLSRRDNVNMRTLDNIADKVNNYIGVYKYYNNYISAIDINGNRITIGIFDDEIAAATAYNIFRQRLFRSDQVQILNNVPCMSPQEVFSHNIRPKVMCKIMKTKFNDYPHEGYE